MLKSYSQFIYRLLLIQIICYSFICALMVVLFWEQPVWSAVDACLISFIVNTYFALKVFKHRGASNARKITNAFYTGEAIKLLLFVALLVVVYHRVKIDPLVFIATIFVNQCAFFVSLLIIKLETPRM